MDKLSMCRICLVEDVKMYSLISANLQELYERLTRIPFESKDNRPIQICYLCCARLQNCYRLQAVCLKSEEFFNKVIADSELNEMELQDLNTLKTVHPLILISCVPSTRKHLEDDKIDEDNDFKFDPSEIASDVQIKHELYEDDSCTDEEVQIKSEITVEEEDICAKYGDISDNNRHTMQNTELEHDIHLKTVKIVLERIDLEAFKIGAFAAKKPKSGHTEITMSTKPETKVTVVQNNNIKEKIQTTESPATDKNENSVKQISFKKKRIEKKKIKLSSDADDSSIKVHRCVVCEKTFSGKGELLRHTRTHTGEKPHRCKICEKSFAQKGSLVLHTRRHTGDRPYRCNVCDKSFVAKNLLLVHSRIHTGEKPFSCKICEKSFSHNPRLVIHMRTHTGARPYRCDVCEKRFRVKSALLQHRRLHTGEKSYRCKICEKSFSWKSVLRIHTRRHTGERPHRCNVCEKSFVAKDDFLKHSRVHTGEKPYSCKICEKSFSQRHSLVEHTRIHTGEKPYRCKICEKSFSRSSHLASHTLTHSAERPYTCDICQKIFSRKSYLIRHIPTHMKIH